MIAERPWGGRSERSRYLALARVDLPFSPSSPDRPASVRVAPGRSPDFHLTGPCRSHAVGVDSRPRRRCAEPSRDSRGRRHASATRPPTAGPARPVRSAISAILDRAGRPTSTRAVAS